ncbi:glycosyl transferase [Paenibacillus graminis]|uniref:Glycosyl transferase n=2 Tax=Paenibacillus graminis TaxID=189425 RepID=A0A089M583_9BACL|nr:glycosyl transferase [Paenibacillus graminis]
MSNVLFLSVSAHGHVNPTLGLVHELIQRGETVTYFGFEEFRAKIEQTGAVFKSYKEKLLLFQDGFGKANEEEQAAAAEDLLSLLTDTLRPGKRIIEDVLDQIQGLEFDYVIYTAAFPFGNAIAQILKIPAVASMAIIATPAEFMLAGKEPGDEEPSESANLDSYQQIVQELKEAFDVEMPSNILDCFYCKGDISIIYTSKAFIAHPEYYDDSYKFIGPPIFDRQEKVDFPFEQLEGKTVIYISMGTRVSTIPELYDLFFKSFADFDAVVVMTAYNMDISQFSIPDNFIVRNYVPQLEVLKYTDVAVTHAGMNSTSDLLYSNVPFVAIPITADQPYMAARAQDLGAAIALDVLTLTPQLLRASVKKVLADPGYREHIHQISKSFKEAGGYPKAVDEIFKLIEENGKRKGS